MSDQHNNRPVDLSSFLRVIWQPQVWLAAVLALIVMFAPMPLTTRIPSDRTIKIEASMFQFSPETVRVQPGDRVTIELASTDVVHGLALDGYGIHLEADPGQTARVTFIADLPGVFTFRCSIACGNLHPFMLGKLQVGPNWLLLRGAVLLGLAALLGIIQTWRKANTPAEVL